MREKNCISREYSRLLLILVLAVLVVSSGLFGFMTGEPQASAADQAPSSTSPHSEVEKTRGEDSAAVAEQTREAAHSLFERAPLGWDAGTITLILGWIAALPQEIPESVRYVSENRIVLVALGAAILAVLVASLLYGFIGRKRVFERAKEVMLPLLERTLKVFRIFVIFLVKTVIASLVPLLLWSVVVIILSLLGLLGPLQHIMSFPILTLGGTSLSFWIIIRAAIIFLAFVYVSQLLRTYLDYKFYPSLGIDTGLAYALNRLLKYLFIATGLLFALRIVGVDLRVLMVLAGTAGIGIGFGLQNIVANMICGLIIIFGRKLRMGDWVKVGDTVGVVSDIYLRATKVLTRDNIDYVIPNTDFITKTIVNYTLTSPFVRVHVPVAVSDGTDPQEVTKILLACAEEEAGVSRYDKPKVWFVAMGDSSINFELLVWTDIRRFSQKEIRSRIYFKILEALRDAEIELPSPQRDIRIRSALPLSASSPRPDEENPDLAA